MLNAHRHRTLETPKSREPTMQHRYTSRKNPHAATIHGHHLRKSKETRNVAGPLKYYVASSVPQTTPPKQRGNPPPPPEKIQTPATTPKTMPRRKPAASLLPAFIFRNLFAFFPRHQEGRQARAHILKTRTVNQALEPGRLLLALPPAPAAVLICFPLPRTG